MQKPLSNGAPLRVLDLFSGLGGWSAGFRDRGHHVTTLDLDPRFGADIQCDILGVNGLGQFDVILASPPCETFSVMTIGKYWTGGRGAYEPKNDRARHGLAIMHKTFELIEKAKPRFYVIENPRGVMRKVAPRPPTSTTWYCRWGMPYAKPTDLWTNIRGAFPACRNGGPDHPYTPRGEKRHGAQGQMFMTNPRYGSGHWDMSRVIGRGSDETRALRALIPYRLSLAVALAAEREGVLPPMEDVLVLEAVYRPPQRATEAA